MNKNILKGIMISIGVIFMTFIMISGLHIRIVTADYIGENDIHDTLELHNFKWEECEEVIYPYGNIHKVNVWFAW